jgi:5-methylcytosine-specific restriction endonuclease McrA
MNELPYISDHSNLQQVLRGLRALRNKEKIKLKVRYSLSKANRKLILEKTGGRCHVCGTEISMENFEADHVKSHSTGGGHLIDNFLPACRTCNNYRWHYLPQEINWILKLGIWARTELENNTKLGQIIGKRFIAHEIRREKRRKGPRI